MSLLSAGRRWAQVSQRFRVTGYAHREDFFPPGIRRRLLALQLREIDPPHKLPTQIVRERAQANPFPSDAQRKIRLMFYPHLFEAPLTPIQAPLPTTPMSLLIHFPPLYSVALEEEARSHLVHRLQSFSRAASPIYAEHHGHHALGLWRRTTTTTTTTPISPTV